jgi:hypothetical protein
LIHLGRWYGYTFSMRALNKSLLVCNAAWGSECQIPNGHLWTDMYCCLSICCFCFRCFVSCSSQTFSSKKFHQNKKPRFIGGAAYFVRWKL